MDPEPMISRRLAVGGLFTAGASMLAVDYGQAKEPGGQVVDAVDHGVVADGVTDNAPAMNRAIAAMTNGARLVLPAGVIALGSPGWTGIYVRRLSDIRIVGNGAVLKWLALPSQATGPFGPTGLRLHECRAVHISALNINGNGIDCIGLGLDTCSGCVLSDIDAYAHGGAPGSGLGQFASCKGSGNSWLSCRAHDSTPGSQFRGFYLGNANSGWGEVDLRIQACSANNNDATGFAIGAVRLICVGSSADGNAGAGFISGSTKGSGSVDHLFVGNISRRNAFHGWQSDVYGPNVERIVLAGNNFSDNAHCGVFCHKGSNISICQNSLFGNGAPTGAGAVEISMSNNVIVSDNLIEGDVAHGICISVGLSANRVNGVVICNNTCTGSASKTVWLEARDDATSLKGIVFSGNIVNGGSHGLFLGTSAPRGKIDDVTISGNIIDGASVASYYFCDQTAGQSTNVRLVGNAGGRALIAASASPAADMNNCWNAAVGHGIAPPRVGTWQQGAIVHNSAPSPGKPIGWVCTESGTPGSWHAFGLVENPGKA